MDLKNFLNDKKSTVIFFVIGILIGTAAFYFLMPKNLPAEPIDELNPDAGEPNADGDFNSEYQDQLEQELFAGFSVQEKELLTGAKNAFAESSGHDVVQLMDFFENSNDLQKLMVVCSRQLVVESVTCYRLLAIKKPEQKTEICSQIEDAETHTACLKLLPFIR